MSQKNDIPVSLKSGKGKLGLALVLMLGVGAGFFAQNIWLHQVQAQDASEATPFFQNATTSPSAAPLVSGLPDFTQLVERSSPAVVNIRTTQKVAVNQNRGFSSEDEQMAELFRRFFGTPMPQQPAPRTPKNGKQAPQEKEVPSGLGSGFIITQDGYIMTNAHVVDGASEVYVKLNDKREFKAKVIGSDQRTDVALIKIESTNLPRLNRGDSEKIRAGEWVIAIGSPFDLDNTVTAGIISSKLRDTGDYLPLIQTDVAVNPGNSGGPLINMRGEVIGINSQIYSRSGGYMGISFAIPIDEAMRVVEQLRSSGAVTRGRIGVEMGDLSKEIAESLGMPKLQGALVARVEANGPAEKAGLQEGDVILKVNSTVIEKRIDLPRVIGMLRPGSKATLTVWRKGAAREVPVVIGAAEPDRVALKKEKQPKEESTKNHLGIYVSDLTEAQKRSLPNGLGVVIESVEGPALMAGLQAGDVILMMNQVDIKDAKQFEEMIAKLDAKKSAVLLVRRGQTSQFVMVKPINQ
jgi:serine protease Do